MRKGLLRLLVLIVMETSQAQAQAQAHALAHASSPMKVLFVGNSLTYYNALPSLVAALAATSTPRVLIDADMLAEPGATIRQNSRR